MSAVMRRCPIPKTDVLKGWIDCAREELIAYKMMQTWGPGFTKKKNQSVLSLQIERRSKNLNPARKQERDPDAMDIDVIRRGKPTPEEIKKLRAEGRCFWCRKQGHVSKNCPDKKKTGSKTGKAKARTIETEESGNESDDNAADIKSQASFAPSAMSSATLVSQIKKLSIDEKESVFNELFDQGF